VLRLDAFGLHRLDADPSPARAASTWAPSTSRKASRATEEHVEPLDVAGACSEAEARDGARGHRGGRGGPIWSALFAGLDPSLEIVVSGRRDGEAGPRKLVITLRSVDAPPHQGVRHCRGH
jgi:hypothetical protein